MISSTIANVLYGHFNIKRNKIIWIGSLENLKALVLTEVDEDTAQNTTWRSPGGGKWSFESKMLSITWHSKSEYIYFGGEKGNSLLKRVQSFLEQGEDASSNGDAAESQLRKSLENILTEDSDDASITDDISQNSLCIANECEGAKKLINQHEKHGEAAPNPKSSKYEIDEPIIEATSTDNLHKEPLNLHTAPKPDNMEFIKKTKKHSPLGKLSSTYDHGIEINLLKSKLDRFAENVSTKLDDLAFEINHIKENKPYSIVILEDIINELKKEKLQLSRINNEQHKRIINMSHTISDLQSSNRNLEDEKSSLLTVIRLIQSDYSQSGINATVREVENEGPCTWKVSKQKIRSKPLSPHSEDTNALEIRNRRQLNHMALNKVSM